MTVYYRTTRQRKSNFQLSTKIINLNGKIFIRKTALSENAHQHIREIISNYSKIKGTSAFQVLPPKDISDSSLEFDFVPGKQMFAMIVNYVKDDNYDEVNNLVQKYIDLILSPLEFKTQKDLTDFDNQIFTTYSPSSDNDLVYPGIIDLTFDNIFIDINNKFTLIDYEWLIDMPLPKNYLLFKAISGVINQCAQLHLNIQPIIDRWGYLFTDENIQMEMEFQNYVNTKQVTLSDFKTHYINIKENSDVHHGESYFMHLKNVEVHYNNVLMDQSRLQSENIGLKKELDSLTSILPIKILIKINNIIKSIFQR